ncbi:unnamed protein product [Phytomonas sp. EM1]|nr:unnamed protein product [Phytomonas sp. EM1]|eukprot:CCW62108.1 unnamed protein product [Phytomonas sp. isolate EM1]
MEERETSYSGLEPETHAEITLNADCHDALHRPCPNSDLQVLVDLRHQSIGPRDADDPYAISEQCQSGEEILIIGGKSFEDVENVKLHAKEIKRPVKIEEPVSLASLDMACNASENFTGCTTLTNLDLLSEKSQCETSDILISKILTDDMPKVNPEKELDSKKRRRPNLNEKKVKKRDNDEQKAMTKASRKRTRSKASGTTAHKTDDEEIKAFRSSQRALLKEAKHVSMKDIMLRSLNSLTNLEDGLGTSSSPESPCEWSNSRDPVKFLSDTVGLASTSPLDIDVSIENGTREAATNFDRADDSNPASLSFMSPPALSFSSPTLVDSITSRFIATAQRQKKQNVERLLPLELTYSQRSHPSKSGLRGLTNYNSSGAVLEESSSSTTWVGPGGHPKLVSQQGFSDSDEELIIGVNDDQEWRKPDKGIHNVPSDRYTSDTADGVLVKPSERGSESCLASSRLPSYLGGGASPTGTPSGAVDGVEDEDESSQVAIARAITRRHEMWKLRHREMKGQRLVEQDERCKGKKNTSRVLPSSHSATLSAQVEREKILHPMPGGSAVLSTSIHASTEVHLDRSLETFTSGTLASAPFPAAGRVYAAHSSNSQSIQHVKLSEDDLSMIRRLNSFDHTATQRVVVFESTKRKE